jgi:hypothetical protein
MVITNNIKARTTITSQIKPVFIFIISKYKAIRVTGREGP